jgi:radical SAM superfamily enzyme YgiQ (UPF0313 family)
VRKSIYLIQPTTRNASGELHRGRSVIYTSLALSALSSTIPPEWEKHFCIEYFRDVDYDSDASVVGISSMGYDLLHGLEIAEEFRRRGKKVLFGGPQACFSRDRVLPKCDALIQGHPGPHEMSRILDDAAADRLAPEYRCGVRIDFPFDYSVLDGLGISFMPALTSVGCRRTCTFCCTAALYRGRYRLRRLDDVLTDLRTIRERSRTACFVDANLFNNREYLLRLARRIAAERLGLRWAAQATLDIGDDPELLRALREAGCRFLLLGIESLSQESLDWCRKGYAAARHEERLRRIRDAGIAAGGYFVLALDGDTPATFDALYDFVQRTRIALPVLNLLLPAPGTEVFDTLDRERRLLVREEEEFLRNGAYYAAASSHCFFVPRHMPPQQAEEEFLDLYRRLVSLRQILRRSLASDPTMTAILLKLNLEMRKEYRAIARARASAGAAGWPNTHEIRVSLHRPGGVVGRARRTR